MGGDRTAAPPLRSRRLYWRYKAQARLVASKTRHGQDAAWSRCGMVSSKQSGDPTLFELRRMGRIADRLLSRALGDAGLTPDQLQVLLMVEAQPGVSAVVLAQAIDLDAPTVSRLVNGLAQREAASISSDYRLDRTSDNRNLYTALYLGKGIAISGEGGI